MQNALLPAPQEPDQLLQQQPKAGLLAADVDRLKRSLDQSVSANTRAMYASAWRSFEAWDQARGNLSLPAAPPLVAAYLAYLAYLAEERHLSVASIRLHRAALAAIHKSAGHEDPTDNEGVRRAMKGVKGGGAHLKADTPKLPSGISPFAAMWLTNSEVP